MEKNQKIECRRCGKCCLADLFAYVTEEDISRWKEEKREDILRVIGHEHGVWMGDHLVSAETGDGLHGCPFFSFDGKEYGCAIYETRPATCRSYEPGSSEICPQFSEGN